MKDSPYVPLDCSLHDRLEAAATLRRRVLIRYRGADGSETEEHAIITDVRARDGAEYVQLSSGTEMRLDHIVSLDGLRF